MVKAVGSSNPTIKLIMLDGPLSGQIFDFETKSKVHIGRIVRGNAVTIKDAGVSSKHLLIEFHLPPGHWMVSDLDSSNGTFMNGRLLDKFTPEPISHGDVIKIGEATSISVEIGFNEEQCLMRRNPPRPRGRAAGKNKKAVSELEENLEDLDGRMNKVGKVEAKGEENAGPVRVKQAVEIGVNEEECMVRRNPPRRGGRPPGKGKKVVSELEENRKDSDGTVNKVGKVEANGEENAGPIRVSSVKQERISGVWVNSGEIGAQVVEKEDEIKEGSKRVTRGMRKKANLMGDLKEKQEVSQQRTTRSMQVLDSVEESVGQANKKTRRGRKGKQNLEAEAPVENAQSEKEDVVLPSSSDSKLDETKDARADNEKPVVNEEAAEMCQQGAAVDPLVLEKSVKSGIEGCMNSASSSGSKHHTSAPLDLENMTLGDLFDHWEVSLPKQIIDATELMISDMREKAKRFHEYRLQKMKEKEATKRTES